MDILNPFYEYCLDLAIGTYWEPDYKYTHEAAMKLVRQHWETCKDLDKTVERIEHGRINRLSCPGCYIPAHWNMDQPQVQQQKE